MIVIEESFHFGLLLGQNKLFEDVMVGPFVMSRFLTFYSLNN